MPKHKVVLPDTNAVLRYLLGDHAAHSAQAAIFFEAVREGDHSALLLEGVLVECVHVLTKFYRVPRVETAAKLHGLLLYKGICNPDRAELLAALKRYGETKLDIVDCLLIAKGSGADMEVFSFDAKVLSGTADSH